MIFKNRVYVSVSVALLALLGVAGNVSARENVPNTHHKVSPKTTDAGCQPANAAIDLAINNVDARLMTGGDMWWNIQQNDAAYQIPAGSGKCSQFAASCWIGGFDKQGQLKVAGQTYRQSGNDYWPGALDLNAKITAANCNLWDHQWKIDASTINEFIALSKSGGDLSNPKFEVINKWPGAGSANAGYSKTNLLLNQSPYQGRSYGTFKDINGNGIYEPQNGEYPVLESNGVQTVPDELIWWVFNDAGNVKQMSLTAAIGVEVQTSAFAFASQDFLNNSTFCNYRVINRGALTIDSTYIAVWDDCDLGYAYDDYIGCDTAKGLGIQYNGNNDDGLIDGHPVNSYGPNPPQVGLDFFQGPIRLVDSSGVIIKKRLSMTNFTYFNNDNSVIGNPTDGIEMYFYMTGSIRDGQRFSYDFQGAGQQSKGYGSGPVSNFVFWGDPGDKSAWSECTCQNPIGDRRFIFSSGPFELVPGAVNDITFGCVWAPQPAGGCPVTNFNTIKTIDVQAQELFDTHFKTIEGPEAPNLVVRELDRKLVFYIVNPQGSNNYAESYGRDDGTYKDSTQYHDIVIKSNGSANPNDSLYKFEGYRIFQLAPAADGALPSSNIFDPTTGEVDPTKAFEVKDFDVKDGVKQIVNYVQNLSISDTTNVPQIKIDLLHAQDSGIQHSFELTQDAFATGSDIQFINYHTYYFMAIAYAYNNFVNFDPKNPGVTQDAPYLGSKHAAGGSPILVVPAIPNPTNAGQLGSELNSDYGTGVVITRVEGQGNGGNAVEMNAASEDSAVYNNAVSKAVYSVDSGPIKIKVIDPVNVGAYNWTLQIINNPASPKLDSSANWRITVSDLKGNVLDTIYSETSIGSVNEQILENYGISVSLTQVAVPGEAILNPSLNGYMTLPGNGYITSYIKFADSTQPWLSGVTDQNDSSFANWLHSGNDKQYNTALNALTNPCYFNDNTVTLGHTTFLLDSLAAYTNMLSQSYTPVAGSWGPYVLAAAYYNEHLGTGTQCGFEVAWGSKDQTPQYFAALPDVDLVFTSDKSKWTRCAVIEEQEDPLLAQGGQSKFFLRKHAGWGAGMPLASDNNTPIYSEADSDKGMSWFPGYAINEGTGQRLNIVFGEDSYLSSDNGSDMIWNPTSSTFNFFSASILFGGKHIIYVAGTQYDGDKAFAAQLNAAAAASASSQPGLMNTAYSIMQWVGVPLLNPLLKFKSLGDGQIPTTTKLSFRVNRPFAPYYASDTSALPMAVKGQSANPYYTFTTSGLQPSKAKDNAEQGNPLSKINAVPNPYYGYSGFEQNRFDTKVRIINLPPQTYINIYTLDGKLIRSLSKSDPNTPYIDWDLKNTAGLPIASGMYLIHVNAVGFGETVIKWFGAMRPLDVTSY